MTKRKVATAKEQPKPRKKTAAKPVDLSLPGDGSIPPFLLVKNRKPLTAAQQVAYEQQTRVIREQQRADSRKPKGMSQEEWQRWQAERAEARKAKSYEQLGRMHARRQQREAEIAARIEQRVAVAEAGPKPLKKPPQEGSRKRQVYDALMKSGQPAALKLGKKLELKEGTITSWFGAWARQAASEQASVPAPKSKAKSGESGPADAGVVDRHPRTDGKRRVYAVDVGWTAQGTVEEEGDQPVVHWDNGNVTAVLPEWVTDLPTARN